MSLRLAIFDLDGTLKQARDPYVYLHKALGTWESSLVFHDKGLSGELDYDEWLGLDAALWKGTTLDRIRAIFQENEYLPGAQDTVKALQQVGVKVALVSTGLLVHAQQVQAEMSLDRVVANEIFFEAGWVTGLARTHIPEGGKGPVVEQLQTEFGVKPEECLAVGDSPSDVAMFGRVGVGVAINPATEQVRQGAHLVLEEPDMRPLLPRLHQFAPGWIPTIDDKELDDG
ncbi:MAG: HAD family phosphatase [Anaerolineae bacterium]|jgi:phosphoserine phosphatase